MLVFGLILLEILVAPREGRVSRNLIISVMCGSKYVAPREGRVSRNPDVRSDPAASVGRAPRGACE